MARGTPPNPLVRSLSGKKLTGGWSKSAMKASVIPQSAPDSELFSRSHSLQDISHSSKLHSPLSPQVNSSQLKSTNVMNKSLSRSASAQRSTSGGWAKYANLPPMVPHSSPSGTMNEEASKGAASSRSRQPIQNASTASPPTRVATAPGVLGAPQPPPPSVVPPSSTSSPHRPSDLGASSVPSSDARFSSHPVVLSQSSLPTVLPSTLDPSNNSPVRNTLSPQPSPSKPPRGRNSPWTMRSPRRPSAQSSTLSQPSAVPTNASATRKLSRLPSKSAPVSPSRRLTAPAPPSDYPDVSQSNSDDDSSDGESGGTSNPSISATPHRSSHSPKPASLGTFVASALNSFQNNAGENRGGNTDDHDSQFRPGDPSVEPFLSTSVNSTPDCRPTTSCPTSPRKKPASYAMTSKDNASARPSFTRDANAAHNTQNGEAFPPPLPSQFCREDSARSFCDSVDEEDDRDFISSNSSASKSRKSKLWGMFPRKKGDKAGGGGGEKDKSSAPGDDTVAPIPTRATAAAVAIVGKEEAAAARSLGMKEGPKDSHPLRSDTPIAKRGEAGSSTRHDEEKLRALGAVFGRLLDDLEEIKGGVIPPGCVFCLRPGERVAMPSAWQGRTGGRKSEAAARTGYLVGDGKRSKLDMALEALIGSGSSGSKGPGHGHGHHKHKKEDVILPAECEKFQGVGTEFEGDDHRQALNDLDDWDEGGDGPDGEPGATPRREPRHERGKEKIEGALRSMASRHEANRHRGDTDGNGFGSNHTSDNEGTEDSAARVPSKTLLKKAKAGSSHLWNAVKRKGEKAVDALKDVQRHSSIGASSRPPPSPSRAPIACMVPSPTVPASHSPSLLPSFASYDDGRARGISAAEQPIVAAFEQQHPFRNPPDRSDDNKGPRSKTNVENIQLMRIDGGGREGPAGVIPPASDTVVRDEDQISGDNRQPFEPQTIVQMLGDAARVGRGNPDEEARPGETNERTGGAAGLIRRGIDRWRSTPVSGSLSARSEPDEEGNEGRSQRSIGDERGGSAFEGRRGEGNEMVESPSSQANAEGSWIKSPPPSWMSLGGSRERKGGNGEILYHSDGKKPLKKGIRKAISAAAKSLQRIGTNGQE
eukprot:TRINITY_DN6931_c0_g2_i1.p1 TRINITY_DN6931_c0_g2~~TRINITY_DN6931_c0_g2_i1.p1  ORF type:complete len:1253 (-),score=173.47 TRINITY_DN6931_c0_g2_i1:508-3810(-)